MKIFWKAIACFSVLCFCFGCVVPASATELTATDAIEEGTAITQFYYVVYDKYGNVKEEGLTAASNARYTWEGITLSNGDYAQFLNANTRAFSIFANTRYDFTVFLNRKATMSNFLVRSNYDGSEAYAFPATWTTSVQAYSRADTVDQTAYYYFEIGNYSSDSVTIESVELLF